MEASFLASLISNRGLYELWGASEETPKAILILIDAPLDLWLSVGSLFSRNKLNVVASPFNEI